MRPTLSVIAALFLCAISGAQVQRGAPLPRKGYFGVAAGQDAKGLKIARVVSGADGEKCGLQVGDVLEALNGKRLKSPAEFAAMTHKLSAGDRFTFKVLRDGKESTLTGVVTPRPEITEPDLDVIYDQVLSQGKRIRVIITKPKGDGKFPTLFLIGGIGAYSVDAPFSSMIYGAVVGPIAHEGYVTVRIDKPGQGDSEGPEYRYLTFKTEEDAYLQALRLTKTLPYVDRNRIAIYGHSMGGCFAPLVAAQEPVKATIVNGTLFQSWTEYMLENTRRQSELGGADEAQLDQEQKNLDAVMQHVWTEGLSPAQAEKKYPKDAAAIESTFPDGETYSGVGIPFFRELSQINLPEAWKNAKGDVLAIYCQNDFLSGQSDHQRIVDYVNKLRPGTAEFKLLPGIDHAFRQTTSMKDSMDHWATGAPFNPVIVQALEAYLKQELGS